MAEFWEQDAIAPQAPGNFWDGDQQAGVGEQIGRKLALGTRDVVSGLAKAPGMLYDAARLPVNAGIWSLNQLGKLPNAGALSGINLPYARSAEENTKAALDSAGLPTAQTSNERLISAVNEGGASALTPVGAGVAASRAPTITLQNIGQFLKAAPGSQAVSGIGAGAGGELAKESGAGPVMQTAATLGGAIAAPLATGTVGALARGATLSPDVAALRDAGVRLTPGQLLGNGAQVLENKAANVPFVGDIVRTGQTRAFKDFNTATVNRALEPIEETVTRGTGAGQPTIAEAQDILQRAYNDVIPRLTGRITPEFLSGLGAVESNLRSMAPTKADQFKSAVEAVFKGKVEPDGLMSGGSAKDAMSQLTTMAKDYLHSADPDQRLLGAAFDKAKGAITAMLAQSNPEAATTLKAIDTAYAQFIRPERAAGLAAKTEGVFSPGQLISAVKASDPTIRDRATSGGRALMQDWANTGNRVLGSDLPKEPQMSKMVGGVGLLAAPAYFGAPIAASGLGAAAMYSPIGQRVMDTVIAGRRPEIVRQAAQTIPGMTPYGAALATALMGR